MTAQDLYAIAQREARKAAVRRLVRLNWSADALKNAAVDITEAADRATRAAWPAALADALEAVRAGMTDAALMTLEASFALAGIAAANELATQTRNHQ